MAEKGYRIPSSPLRGTALREPLGVRSATSVTWGAWVRFADVREDYHIWLDPRAAHEALTQID
jgi:hypothetical protein